MARVKSVLDVINFFLATYSTRPSEEPFFPSGFGNNHSAEGASRIDGHADGWVRDQNGLSILIISKYVLVIFHRH